MKQYKFNIFDGIKAIYLKKQIDISEMEMYQNLAITKWLLLDEDNVKVISKIFNYIYWISPQSYFILLWSSIQPKERVPFLHKIDTDKKQDENKLYLKIRDTLQWSDRELKLYNRLLDKIIKPKKDYWEKEMGLK